jgi:hypothetical protein
MIEQQKPILVELLNPPIEDPWRTRGDYIEDQRRQSWQFRLTVAALVVSIIASVSAVASAYAAIQAISQTPPPTCVK